MGTHGYKDVCNKYKLAFDWNKVAAKGHHEEGHRILEKCILLSILVERVVWAILPARAESYTDAEAKCESHAVWENNINRSLQNNTHTHTLRTLVMIKYSPKRPFKPTWWSSWHASISCVCAEMTIAVRLPPRLYCPSLWGANLGVRHPRPHRRLPFWSPFSANRRQFDGGEPANVRPHRSKDLSDVTWMISRSSWCCTSSVLVISRSLRLCFSSSSATTSSDVSKLTSM